MKKPRAIWEVLWMWGLLDLATIHGFTQNHSFLHHFAGSDGDSPASLAWSGDALYGVTVFGGSANLGTVFKMSTNGTDFMVLKHFNGPDGATPLGGLVLSGDCLYGTTSGGGASNCGTVFRLGMNGNSFTVLKHFSGSDGMQPLGGFALSGNTLFGTTYTGGTSNVGTIFKLETNGGGFSVLKEFTDPVEGGENLLEGCLPRGDLAVLGTKLYGASHGGGRFGRGVVFKLNTDGGGYEVLKQGDFIDGGHFISGVRLSGATLYGSLVSGGGPIGAIYKLNTDGSGFAILQRMNGFNGVFAGSLVLFGGRLFATAWQGGDFNCGTLLMLHQDGSQFTVLRHFDGADGCQPRGLVVAGTTLYGVTAGGGESDRGTVYGVSLLPGPIVEPPLTQSAEVGSDVGLSVVAGGAPPLGYVWFFNATNVLEGGTNAWLALTHVQADDVGEYTVVVTNVFGAETSLPATLNVIPTVEKRMVPGVAITAPPGSLLQVEFSPAPGHPADWTSFPPIHSISSPEFFFDLTTPLPPQRFYRTCGSSNAPPILVLHRVTSLTLTGSPGNPVRVEAINQFGPTNAWFTLDTVTLTNTSQLFFDVSALGQPARLYRISPSP